MTATYKNKLLSIIDWIRLFHLAGKRDCGGAYLAFI